MSEADNPFRALPQVQKLLERADASALTQAHGAAALTRALREALAQARAAIGRSEPPATPDAIVAEAAAALVASRRPGLRRVINATGIVIHTNLGRAPLAAEAITAMVEAAGYANLEYDLATGVRGSRTAAVEPLLREVTGAPAALVVNNGAAAILLALSALAQGGEVIVSRGELVEIGGGFRIPDVIRQGGARLVEVGSTNKTRLADYAAAIGPDTRVLLKVHQSNFRTIGFTAETGLAELAGLARAHALRLVADLGSGLVARAPGAGSEPTLREALAAGADVVTCSGDKLLGGPQAGLILGTAVAVDPLRRHPLLRAVRLDKLSLAALEATLRLHRDAPGRVPVLRMLDQAEAQLRDRAARLRDMVDAGEVIATDAYAGGGALPEARIASAALAFEVPGVDAVAGRLRSGDPAVIGRINEGRLLLDMLTVAEADLVDLAGAMRANL